jgi:hypothetical protein
MGGCGLYRIVNKNNTCECGDDIAFDGYGYDNNLRNKLENKILE